MWKIGDKVKIKYSIKHLIETREYRKIVNGSEYDAEGFFEHRYRPSLNDVFEIIDLRKNPYYEHIAMFKSTTSETGCRTDWWLTLQYFDHADWLDDLPLE